MIHSRLELYLATLYPCLLLLLTVVGQQGKPERPGKFNRRSVSAKENFNAAGWMKPSPLIKEHSVHYRSPVARTQSWPDPSMRGTETGERLGLEPGDTGFV